MAFLLKKPFIIIIAAVIASVLIISYSGILSLKPAGLTLSSVSLERSSIKMGQNTTLTVVIENKGSRSQTFELHIVYTSENLTFYDKITGARLPDPVPKPPYYNITHHTKGTLDTQGRVEIPILVKGLGPMGSSQTYTISMEVFSLDDFKKVLADKKSVQLTVTR